MPEFRFLSRMETAPRVRAQIYRLAPPSPNRTKVHDAARMFGLSGELGRGKFQEDETKLSYIEGPLAVTLYRASGGLRFQDLSRWQVDDGKSNVELDDETAVKRAREAIRKFKLAPLGELRALKVSHLRVGSVELASGQGEERIIDVGVAFQRMIGKVPVDGPGGKVIVYLDHQGEVTGIDRIWREILDVYRPVEKLRAPQFAEDDLKQYWSRHTSDHIDVQGIQFAYFELGWKEAQKYLQPAYIMPLKAFGPNERIIMKSVHVSAAATNPVGKLMPPPKVQPRIPKRKE